MARGLEGESSKLKVQSAKRRITWHYDATGNGTTDGSDPVYHFCYDDQWRIAGTWRGSDTDPKEAFTYHNAGVAGRGGSSYIDTVAFRDRDNNGGGGWTGAGDGTLEDRHYYVQNWRANVSAIFDRTSTTRAITSLGVSVAALVLGSQEYGR